MGLWDFLPLAELKRRTLSLTGPLFPPLLVFALCVSSSYAGEQSLNDAIRRVENGLLPATASKENIDVRTSIAQRMKDLGIAGVSVAVIDGGRLVWARGYGVTETGGGQAVTPTTLFQAGSISKPVAAMGALKLVERGKLSLDEDINRTLTSWKLPDNEFTASEKVTLRRIVSHRAGLTVHGFPGYEAGTPVPSVVQVLNGESPANTAAVRVDTIPGTLTRYSGGGFTIMQLAVSDVSGQSFAKYMNKAVLAPLGMKHSTYEQPLPTALQARAATGHYAGGRQVVGRYHTYPEMAAAGLWTTPSDLAKYLMEVQRIVAGHGKGVLRRTTVEEMLKSQDGNFGLGPVLMGEGDMRRFGHGGVDDGFDAFMVGYVNSGRGAVVMANSNFAQGGLLREIVESVARVYEWPDYPPAKQLEVVPIAADVVDAALGRYELHPGYIASLVDRDGRLTVETMFGEAEVFGRPDGSFAAPLLGIESMQFVKDETGKVAKILIRRGESTREVKRLSE